MYTYIIAVNRLGEQMKRCVHILNTCKCTSNYFRYLKEMFAVLVPSGIVHANDDATEFYLPESHRGPLVATGFNPVNYTWAACRMFQSYTDVLECCKVNGPLGRHNYFVAKLTSIKCNIITSH